MNPKQMRLQIGKVKLNAVCIRCSQESHTYNRCSNKPHCKHDGLTHSVGDKQKCEAINQSNMSSQCICNT